MSHYDFSRMGWQQFEHMVQALAKAELGNGVKAFGSGRDGQREATFSGAVNFPVGGSQGKWNGYGVLQAKYLERPKDTTSDGNWLLKEVREELRGWVTKKQEGKRTPRYFLAASSVVLSGTENSGGKDRFDTLLESFRDELELVDWFAWDDTELRTLLDKHTSIRQRYLELILVGDFLAAIEEFAPKVALTAKRLAVNAAAEVTSKQWVRTGDSGFSDSSKLKLADIGIDLPCLGRKTRDHPHGERFKAARWAIDIGDYVGIGSNREPKGVVFVGGPGQGKSTLAQLIAHTYRIAFIEGTDPQLFGSQAQSAVEGLKNRLRAAGIPTPQRHRWPILIELAKMGAAVAKRAEDFSLLGYLADTVVVDGTPTKPAELLEWMKSWPVCLVLDGLDEVADSRIRIRLSQSIAAFVTEANANAIDLFIVATTRPQGYRGEFSDAFPVKQTSLAEFTETEALAYSDALVGVRNAEDPDLAAQVTERLITAVHERVTQRLMTTPLQVTIMTALAERSVDLPTNRYELFEQYYQVVYDREVAKDDAFTELRRLKSHIDHLHERAALKLHERAETGTGSAAPLTSAELSRILVRRLTAAGFESANADEIATNLLRLSSERLVMLVALPRNRYEFEVRSLQEYMAARALTDGTDAEILRRLELLLPSSHWRNTWLLAAGRVLRSREHLANELFGIVAAYDGRGNEERLTLIGSSLASDLLLDDIASEFPNIQRSLQTAALVQLAATIKQLPVNLGLVLDRAMAAGGQRQSDALAQLDAISQESLSNLASLYLSQHRSGMSPLAKQARVTMGSGRNYVAIGASEDGGILDPALATLAEYLPHVDAAEVSALSIALMATRVDAKGSGEIQLLEALNSDGARAALVGAARAMKGSNPSASRAAARILRISATQAPRGHQLQ